MARYIYRRLDDCVLDSLEQARLNNWLTEVDLEISIRDQYLESDLYPGSINYEVDSASYTPAIPMELSDFYFGFWINSPSSVTFVSCDGNPVYRSNKFNSNGFQIFPNPTDNGFYISVEDEGNYNVKITDLTGRVASEKRHYFETNTPAQVIDQKHLSSGQYIVSLMRGDSTLFQKRVVN